jgi:hypothetical protein
MTRWATSTAVAATLLVLPGTAVAGAPNYDCVFGDHGRLAIDQWRDVVATTAISTGPTRWGTTANERQNGPSLDLAAVFRGETWSIAIRETGKSLVVTRPGGVFVGHCLMIPGSHVLHRTDAGGFTLRDGPSGRAKPVLRVPVGSAVWEAADSARGGWIPLNTSVAQNRTLLTRGGWLRQRAGSVAP